MAKVEKVSIYCDGPCGGNEVTPGAETTFILRTSAAANTQQNRQVDLCPDCAGPLVEMYAKATPIRTGRPRKESSTPDLVLARTGGGTVEVVEPLPEADTPAATKVTPVTPPPVPDPFDSPVGTGV